MIRITVFEKNGQINKISMNGHALFDDYGKDIVCAAVSATYLCTINAIYSIQEDSIKIDDYDNEKVVYVLSGEKVVITLLDNMVRCLSDLERQYPKNIRIAKEEI